MTLYMDLHVLNLGNTYEYAIAYLADKYRRTEEYVCKSIISLKCVM